MKLLLILFSFFNFFNKDFNKKEINLVSNYEEVENIETNYGNYKILEENKKIEILYDDNRLILINNIYHYKIVYNNETLTFFYKNDKKGYVTVYKYNKGKLITNVQIENKFINLFDVIYYRNTYILATSIEEYENEKIITEIESKSYLQNINAIIVQLNDDLKIISCKIYGGELNDFFETIYYDYNNDYIYVTGKKDQLSGYDFGNGGNGVTGYVLCLVNDFLELKDYVIFENDIKNLELSENIKIYTNKECFVLNTDLSVISSLIFDSESIYAMGMDKYWVATFGIRELKIYDFNKNICVQIYDYQDIYELDKVRIVDDKLILISQDKILKGVFYNDLFSEKRFIYDDLQISKLNTTIYGIPSSFELKTITYEENFDPLVFGIYDLYFNYDGFTILSKIEVLERSNVTEGYIYPTGYNLFFSGIASLNGEEIFNNHEITKEGEYCLVLQGKEKTKEIKFKVYNMDINYNEESLKNWDYEIRVNHELIIDFCYNEEVIIKQLVINNQLYDFINDEENNKITFSIIKNETGIYEYLINKIFYEKNDIEFEHVVNYYFKVKVIQEKISLNNNFYNNDEYFIFHTNVLNNDNQLRFLKIVSQTNCIFIPIRNGKIELNEYFENTENLRFYLVYDVLGKLYEEQLLFEMDYDIQNTKEVGEMELVFEGDTLTDIIIKIENSKKVKTIIVNDVVQYQCSNSKNYVFVIYSIIFVIILFTCFKVFKIIKNKNNKD